MFTGIIREWEAAGGICRTVKNVGEALYMLKHDTYHLTAIAMSKHGLASLPMHVSAVRGYNIMPIVVIATELFEDELRRWILHAGIDYLDTTSESAAEHVITCKALIRMYMTERDMARRRKLTEITNGDLYFCLEHRTVRIRGEKIDLTPIEFDILSVMISNPQMVFSHEMLLHEVWRDEGSVVTRKTISNHIARLRTKLRIAPDVPKFIISIRGVGFKYQHIDLC